MCLKFEIRFFLLAFSAIGGLITFDGSFTPQKNLGILKMCTGFVPKKNPKILNALSTPLVKYFKSLIFFEQVGLLGEYIFKSKVIYFTEWVG